MRLKHLFHYMWTIKEKPFIKGATIQMTVLATVYTNFEADQVIHPTWYNDDFRSWSKNGWKHFEYFVQLQLKEMEYVDDVEFEYALNAIVDGNAYPFEKKNSQFSLYLEVSIHRKHFIKHPM